MAVQRGDIVALGKHRLMCGDSTSRADVEALFEGAKTDAAITSPPYLQQRRYGDDDHLDWDVLMRRACDAIPCHEDTQLFVNVGLVHRNHEWIPYWHEWAMGMSDRGWLRLAWYVWDKLDGLPTVPNHGRLYACHEFVFHFARGRRTPNKTVPCKSAGLHVRNVAMRGYDAMVSRAILKGRGVIVQSHRIADSVMRASPRGSSGRGHVAPFPPALPATYMNSFTQPGQIVYDPFGGSGTTMIAAEDNDRRAYIMEKEPRFCDIAVARFEKHKTKRRAS